MEQEIFQLKPLFEDVQMNRIFKDGKTFVDCVPKRSLPEISNDYPEEKNKTGFSLHNFVLANFELPHVFAGTYKADTNLTTSDHINALWEVLTRQPDEKKGSLIPLPNAYIVPGGRFGEVYYWDSYFTMLGLKESGRTDMIESMVNNFAHLIETIGYIPNGNRTYYIGRSQPPFYALMIELLADIKGIQILPDYLPTLEKEYEFWMNGQSELNQNSPAVNHVVQMKSGDILNRYWDQNDTARPESYREDIELSLESSQPQAVVFKELRAGAASGWDYSSRWFKDEVSFQTIQTTSIIPVDLNCLLHQLEQTIAKAYAVKGDGGKSAEYNALAEKRKQAILQYCWNKEVEFFVDFNWQRNLQSKLLSLAGTVPLFLKLASNEQAAAVAVTIEKDFLKAGGLVTTLTNTGQQWDAPNGWAPLQWMTVVGLKNYGFENLATDIAERWLKLNDDVFKRTGKLMEKYNVVDTHLEAGGGEYDGQDGFGWTNGVYLALKKLYAKK